MTTNRGAVDVGEGLAVDGLRPAVLHQLLHLLGGEFPTRHCVQLAGHLRCVVLHRRTLHSLAMQEQFFVLNI